MFFLDNSVLLNLFLSVISLQYSTGVRSLRYSALSGHQLSSQLPVFILDGTGTHTKLSIGALFHRSKNLKEHALVV